MGREAVLSGRVFRANDGAEISEADVADLLMDPPFCARPAADRLRDALKPKRCQAQMRLSREGWSGNFQCLLPPGHHRYDVGSASRKPCCANQQGSPIHQEAHACAPELWEMPS